jgi:hypothetical protein
MMLAIWKAVWSARYNFERGCSMTIPDKFGLNWLLISEKNGR